MRSRQRIPVGICIEACKLRISVIAGEGLGD
jgi:hypothetical protein